MKSQLFHQYQDNFFSKLSKHTSLPANFYKNKIVLDIGCGKGEDSSKFSKTAKRIVAVDIEKFPYWKIIKSNKIIFKVANAENLPFKSQTFDIVFSKDMLHHTPHPNKALKEMKRVCKKNGTAIIVEGNRYNPISFIHMTKMNGHEHFPQAKFKEMILDNFPNAQFYNFESHFIPFFGEQFLSLLFKLEDIIENFPFISPILSYNIAVIKKIT